MAVKKKKEDATSMASRQREIAVSEFFSKNRHLLGFDNPTKALLTTVREAVDNALDACEEADILPAIEVAISEVSEARYIITVTDNGPGILKAQLGKIFGQLLYGSKFHRLKQSRGQQGIGISAAVMYGQMTTGAPAEVISKTGKGRPANKLLLQIDTLKNRSQIVDESIDDSELWAGRESGTSIAITLEGSYKGGRHSVDAYLRQTALANPHCDIRFIDPKGRVFDYPRVVNELPVEAKEILPHPHGIELGTLMRMLQDAKGMTVPRFLKESFSRVSDQAAKEICERAKIGVRMPATTAGRTEVEALYKAIQETKLMAPPTNCLSPIGEKAIIKGLYWLFVEAQREVSDAREAAAALAKNDLRIADAKAAAKLAKAAAKNGDGQPELFAPLVDDDSADEDEDAKEVDEDAKEVDEALTPAQMMAKIALNEDDALFSEDEGYLVTAVTRPPAVYRGNPFQVEVGIFYGKGLPADEPANVFRFANRVPLQYQQSACAMQKAVISAPWRSYQVNQSRGALPQGPLVIMVHIASGWVPFTSESKEAIAHYDEILKELRLAIMECGRRLQRFLKRKRREADEAKKISYITKYLDPIGEALQEILSLDDKTRDATVADLKVILEREREDRPGSKKKATGKKKATPKSAEDASA